MTRADSANLDRIERDRRRREAVILALLLAFGERSLSHARSAVRVGADPVYAAAAAITGASHVDGPPLADRLEPLLAETYTRGIWRGARLIDVDIEPGAGAASVPAEAWAAEQARTLADRTAQAVRRTVSSALQDARSAGLNTARTLVAVSDAYGAAGLRWGQDFALRAGAERAVVTGYNAGMWGVWNGQLADVVTGFVHRSVLDDATTDICTERDGLKLPRGDIFWTRNIPALHWRCRSVVLPLTGEHEWSETLPETQPDPGFGYAPPALYGVPIGVAA